MATSTKGDARNFGCTLRREQSRYSLCTTNEASYSISQAVSPVYSSLFRSVQFKASPLHSTVNNIRLSFSKRLPVSVYCRAASFNKCCFFNILVSFVKIAGVILQDYFEYLLKMVTFC